MLFKAFTFWQFRYNNDRVNTRVGVGFWGHVYAQGFLDWLCFVHSRTVPIPREAAPPVSSTSRTPRDVRAGCCASARKTSNAPHSAATVPSIRLGTAWRRCEESKRTAAMTTLPGCVQAYILGFLCWCIHSFSPRDGGTVFTIRCIIFIIIIIMPL